MNEKLLSSILLVLTNHLRFPSEKGALTFEMLFDLPAPKLRPIYRELKDLAPKEDDELGDAPRISANLEAQIEVVRWLYGYKKQMAEEASQREETRQHNLRIDELIRRKKEEQLEGMSIEDLLALKK